MHLGVTIRNMGAQSAPDIMLGCAHAAQDRALESVWVTDHIAIPPDDAQGSEGCYTDTLTTLAWLGGRDESHQPGCGCFGCALSANVADAEANRDCANLVCRALAARCGDRLDGG